MRGSSSSAVWFAILAAVATSACATSSGGMSWGPPAFPDREKIDDLVTRAAPAAAAPAPRKAVDAWALAGPFPEHVGDPPMKAGDVVGDIVIGAVAATRTSENLACAAREIGRFITANPAASPEPRLERYLLTRCGANVSDVAWRLTSWKDVDDAKTDAALVDRARATIAANASALVKQDALLGAALVRDRKAKTAIAIVIGAKPKTTLTTAAQTASNGAFVVDGTIKASGDKYEALFAFITKGAFAASECTRDSTVVLPQFRFACAVDAADATALVEVAGRERGRVLSTTLADVLVVQNTELASSWQRVDYAAPTTTPKTAIDAAVLAVINEARKQAGLGALVDQPQQSATAAKLAPHFFGAALASDPDQSTLDLVALGMLAGYDVSGITIHDAAFASLVDFSGRLDETVGEALDRPTMRSLFLSKKATAAAIGVQSLDDKVTGVLLAGYEPMTELDGTQAAAAVVARLDEQRRQRGESETGAITACADIMSAAAARLRSGDDVRAVGKDAVEASASKMHRTLGLWTLEAYDVDHLTFPEGLLTSKQTYTAIAVAARKLPGSAWGSTTILILYATEDSTVRSAE